jgi:hypothetical protein
MSRPQVGGPAMKLVTEFEPIKPGAPDPYTPPNH